jgi:hypothetical protein
MLALDLQDLSIGSRTFGQKGVKAGLAAPLPGLYRLWSQRSVAVHLYATRQTSDETVPDAHR